MRVLIPVLLCCVLLGSCKTAQPAKSTVPTGQVSFGDRDGSSYENAVVVKSIKEEYEWVRVHYPGSQMQSQALMFRDKKPYDALTFKLNDGTTKTFYFDISSFFGKF